MFSVEETLRVLVCLQIMMQRMIRRNQSKGRPVDLVYFEVIKKTCPIPNLNTVISQSETNQCQICAALNRGANLEKGKFFNNESLTKARLSRCSYKT